MAAGIDDHSAVATNPFWEYSLQLYAAPGVENYCLDLQRRQGVNVNLLLFCCWTALQCRQLGSDEIASAAAAIDSWDKQVVQQLRQLRQLIKAIDELEHLNNSAQVELDGPAFRAQLKSLELIAERIVQENLYAWWQNLPATAAVVAPTALLSNLNTYLNLLGVDEADWLTEDHFLVEAAFRPEL